MKKFIIICLIAVIAITSAFAIERNDVRIGVDAGIGFSRLKATYVKNADCNYLIAADGVQLNGSVEWAPVDNVYIKGTFGFVTPQKVIVTVTDGDETETVNLKDTTTEMKIGYNATLTAGYSYPCNDFIEVFTGCGFSILNSTFNVKNKKGEIKQSKNSTAIGACIEAGVYFKVARVQDKVNVGVRLEANTNLLFIFTDEPIPSDIGEFNYSGSVNRILAGIVIEL